MKNRLLLPAFIGLVLSAVTTQAQNRTDNPFQIQLNLSGVVLKTAGNQLTKKEVLNLEVLNWELPGLSAGYHLSSAFYLGYSFHPNRRLILNQRYTFGETEDDVLITVDHETGTAHLIEGRISPFKLGLYLSAYFTYISEAKYTLDAVPTAEYYEVGGNFYTDPITAKWNFKDMKTMGVGAGFNHVFDSGISFNIGAGIPISFIKTVHENVKFFSQDEAFTASDAQHIEDVIRSDQFYVPVQMYFSIGKNF